MGFPRKKHLGDGISAEKINDFDDQDYYHHQFQDEGAALVEFVDHEAVELFGGLQFLLDEVFVVGDADFGGGEFVEAGGKHVAEEFDGVVGALGEFAHVEQDGVEFGGGAGGAPARPEAAASALEEVVDIFKLFGEQLVVMAELEELRVGVLQELDGSLGAGRTVVDEGGVPADYGEIVGIVGNPRLQNFLALAIGERLGLAAHNLRDEVALRSEEVGRRG